MEKKNSAIKPVSQEHAMGCAVACVASLCSMKYQQALKLFKKKEHAWTRGFYCNEIVQALALTGRKFIYAAYQSSKHSDLVFKTGTIIFVSPCSKYPAGHFLIRAKNGWMNPWSNFPLMKPVESSIEGTLPGRVSYLVFEEDWQKQNLSL